MMIESDRVIQSEQCLPHSFWDWIVTIILAGWGLMLNLISAPDWVTVLTVLLLLIKILHEGFRFLQIWRRAKLKRRLADSERIGS